MKKSGKKSDSGSPALTCRDVGCMCVDLRADPAAVKTNRRALGAMECAAIAKIAANTAIQYARLACIIQQFKSWDDIPDQKRKLVSDYVGEMSNCTGKKFTSGEPPKSIKTSVGDFLVGSFNPDDQTALQHNTPFFGESPASDKNRLEEFREEYAKCGGPKVNKVFHVVASALISMESES